MNVETFENGPLRVNTYLITNSNSAVVVDPGEDIEDLLKKIEDNSLKIEGILLTHGHIDHVFSVEFLKEKSGAPVYLNRKDAEMASNLEYQSRLLGMNYTRDFGVDIYVEDGESLSIAGMEIECCLISGHTQGSVCYYVDGSVFTGDTLFNYTVGRTDLLGSTTHSELIQNIRTKLFNKFDDAVVVYPGHGPSSTIGFEKKNNIMFR